jgi:AbrB family looped-hinge helix DNA binding protein
MNDRRKDTHTLRQPVPQYGSAARDEGHISAVTERGQVSIPADLRRALGLTQGRKLLWERASDRELRVRPVDDAPPAGARAVLGFARRFRQTRSTAAWMAELREGEKK